MADNIDEENLDNPANNQLENSSAEITPAVETDSINQNEEVKNMEVHHHPNLNHTPKTWKEYLLEGLMIFIAVTMGFFAESLREYFGDREKEKQSIESVLRCLKSDTAKLNTIITGNEHQVKFIDSLLTLKGKNLHDSLINHQLYFYAANGLFVDDYFKPNDAAMQQLKSSGMLRLIRKQTVIDGLLQYEIDSRDLKSQQDDHYLYAQKSWGVLDQAIDESDFMDSTKFNLSQYNYDNQTFDYYNSQICYVTDDKNLIRLLFGNSATLGLITKLYITLLKGQLEEAKSIISLINKEYKIE